MLAASRNMSLLYRGALIPPHVGQDRRGLKAGNRDAGNKPATRNPDGPFQCRKIPDLIRRWISRPPSSVSSQSLSRYCRVTVTQPARHSRKPVASPSRRGGFPVAIRSNPPQKSRLRHCELRPVASAARRAHPFLPPPKQIHRLPARCHRLSLPSPRIAAGKPRS